MVSVAAAMLENPVGRHWGYQLSKSAGVRSGVMYPILSRMLDEAWLRDGWEDRNDIEGKRPARRYYELTDVGRTELSAVLARARRDPRFGTSPIMARGTS